MRAAFFIKGYKDYSFTVIVTGTFSSKIYPQASFTVIFL